MKAQNIYKITFPDGTIKYADYASSTEYLVQEYTQCNLVEPDDCTNETKQGWTCIRNFNFYETDREKEKRNTSKCIITLEKITAYTRDDDDQMAYIAQEVCEKFDLTGYWDGAYIPDDQHEKVWDIGIKLVKDYLEQNNIEYTDISIDDNGYGCLAIQATITYPTIEVHQEWGYRKEQYSLCTPISEQAKMKLSEQFCDMTVGDGIELVDEEEIA